MKTKMSNGERVLVVNIDYTNASLVEYVGRCGIDAIFIDCEQGGTSIESIEDLARAARCAGVASLVRLFSSDEWVIERHMGRGVDGIVVPRLKTPADMRKVVETVRYCFPKSFPEKIVVVQIEDIAAAEAIDEILEIDGIDAFFIGPVDLSKSMGYDGDFRTGAVAAEVERLIARIDGMEKIAGVLVDENSITTYSELGARFLYLHVNDFLKLGIRHFRQAIGRARQSL